VSGGWRKRSAVLVKAMDIGRVEQADESFGRFVTTFRSKLAAVS
jgi:hypothetical protein